MRSFGGFFLNDALVYGEVRGEEVHILRQAPWLGLAFSGEVRSLGELRLAPPVAPGKVIAVGLNYSEHIKEMQRTEIGSPLIWFKAPSSLLPHEGTIEIAFPEHKTDFETELAVVIGTRAKDVSAPRALEHVFGYTIAEDISDRDLQKAEKQFSRCKSFDTYTPVGPFVYTEVEIEDLEISLRQNGDIKQQARTSQMIYSVADIIAFASQSLTLLPGDLILTGTPSGVGAIRAGDELVAAVGDWPPLRNRVANTAREKNILA
ncbi:MAG TPA: fumarylacetoacetate hydrolase family protein [Chthoniobacterales bacterium]|jgi:2-keto-4-pentenoate hydratase/2-oxohepta-3-ene-1,7-dioic acid hydratase in catechol pathway|nr:fumarylacetoacetate hydrolase family protein [Chthoniobacterales bacterium]